MNEHDESVGRLELVGYEKLTDHGLALPVFGRSPGANVFYTARSSEPGGAGGHIASFDQYDPEALVPLPREQIRETGVGEPMYFCGTTSPMPEPLQRFGTLSQRCAKELRSIHLSAC